MENKKIKTYAPVIIATLCRYEHFKRCIESLSCCTGAEYTELFIGLDYPSKDAHWEGFNKLDQYVDTITGFKKVHIFRREKNYGAGKNFLEVRKIVTTRFDRYITTEDDNEFSPNFLEYINKGLELYKDNPKVVAICGYSYPFAYCKRIDGYPYNAYPFQSYCGWGVGYWIEKNEKIFPFVNPEKAYELIHSWSLVSKLFKKKLHITVHRLLFRHKDSSGDLMWHAYCILNDVYCIFPLISKVRNYGFDGTGLNCQIDSIYERQQIDESATFHFDDFEIKSYKPITHMHDKIYGGTWLIRRLCEIEYFFSRIFGTSFNITSLRKKISTLRK